MFHVGRQVPAFLLAAALLIGCGAGAGPVVSDDPLVVAGEEHYRGNCSVCHGRSGQGLPVLGTNLHESSLVATSSTEELAAFLAVGRSRTDPANTTGQPMPPRGGNSALADEDLLAIAAFVRHLVATEGSS